jgi:hypothetical protein
MTQRLQIKFATYHAENPSIYEAFKKFTFQVIQKRKRFGARSIMERIRWDTVIEGNDAFKINDNYTAYYVRLFDKDFPEHIDFFRKRAI